MEDFLSGRLATLKKRLVSSQLEAILITNLKNIYYLTGFSGTAATVLVTPKRSIFITDARYTLMAKNKVKHFDIIESRTPLKEILTILRADKCQHLAFENEISFAFYQSLQAQFSGI